MRHKVWVLLHRTTYSEYSGVLEYLNIYCAKSARHYQDRIHVGSHLHQSTDLPKAAVADINKNILETLQRTTHEKSSHLACSVGRRRIPRRPECRLWTRANQFVVALVVQLHKSLFNREFLRTGRWCRYLFQYSDINVSELPLSAQLFREGA